MIKRCVVRRVSSCVPTVGLLHQCLQLRVDVRRKLQPEVVYVTERSEVFDALKTRMLDAASQPQANGGFEVIYSLDRAD